MEQFAARTRNATLHAILEGLVAADRKLIAVAIKAGPPGAKVFFEAGLPAAMFETRIPPGGAHSPAFQYDVAADGKRFLMVTGGEQTAQTPLTV